MKASNSLRGSNMTEGGSSVPLQTTAAPAAASAPDPLAGDGAVATAGYVPPAGTAGAATTSPPKVAESTNWLTPSSTASGTASSYYG